MIEFQDKKKIRKVLYSWPVIAVVLVLLVVSVLQAYKMYQNMTETGDNRDTALREQSALQAKQSELTGQIGQLQTTRGVEEEIRKKFRVVKGGESVIIVVDDRASGISSTSTSSSFVSLFERVKSWF